MAQVRVGDRHSEPYCSSLRGRRGQDSERVPVLGSLVAEPHLVQSERLDHLDGRHQVGTWHIGKEPDAEGGHKDVSRTTVRATIGVHTNSIDMIEQIVNID